MKKLFVAMGFVCAGLMAMPATADVIYDNGTYGTTVGYFSDYSDSFVQADDFVLESGSETITDIHWWGIYSDAQLVTDDFTILIYGDDGGAPDTSNVLLNLSAGDVAQTDTGDDYNNISAYSIYAYSLDIAPLALTAGETYYLAIINDAGGHWGWMTTDSGAGSHFYASTENLDNYNSENFDMAFNLTGEGGNNGVVPEPASILLMGLGLGSVAWRARKKRS